jgi:two-component system sensor histidine kinase AlgZ
VQAALAEPTVSPIIGGRVWRTPRMQDSKILSTFQELAPQPPARSSAQAALVFDSCQVGVALRAVLFVEAAVVVAAMFRADTPTEWVFHTGLYTGSALPATVFWLVITCALKRWLARLSEAVQYTVGALMGAVSGLYGCGMLLLSGLNPSPPWLASACGGALLAGILIAMLALRARGRLPADTVARLSELQSRIRPHFLFNTLNSAIALVRAEPAKAEAILEDLSDLFRNALVEHGPSVTLADEITLARRYLDIEQVRFGERLQVEWALDERANEARLPPLLLQPLLENAVRHGVEPSPQGAQIRISTQRRGSTVVLKITNATPAGPGPQGHGLALGNVRDRLRLLHDVQCSFQTIHKNGLFQVRIEVPA